MKRAVLQVRTSKRDWKRAVSEVGGIQVQKLFHVRGAISCVKRELTVGNREWRHQGYKSRMRKSLLIPSSYLSLKSKSICRNILLPYRNALLIFVTLRKSIILLRLY